VSSRPSRLQAINGRLAKRIEGTAGLSPASAAVLFALAVQTRGDGAVWFQLSRLANRTKLSDRRIREAIVEASKLPALLWFVLPARAALLPWRVSEARESPDGEPFAPPPDAWGFFMPDAADSRALAAEAVRWHQAHARAGLHPIEGEGVEAFLARHPQTAPAIDAHAAPANTTTAPPVRARRFGT
jgi:hypothetical protein